MDIIFTVAQTGLSPGGLRKNLIWSFNIKRLIYRYFVLSLLRLLKEINTQ
jgi:hypothetical protein